MPLTCVYKKISPPRLIWSTLFSAYCLLHNKLQLYRSYTIFHIHLLLILVDINVMMSTHIPYRNFFCLTQFGTFEDSSTVAKQITPFRHTGLFFSMPVELWGLFELLRGKDTDLRLQS